MKLFKLSEIGAMKLRQVALLTEEIKVAVANGWNYHADACRKELELTKWEATHPQEVFNG